MLHISFLYSIPIYLPLGSSSIFTIITVFLFFSSIFTLMLLRSNLGIYHEKNKFLEHLKEVWKLLKLILIDPFFIILLLLIIFLCFCLRYTIFLYIPFSVSLAYFCFFFVIIFSLWLPCLFISQVLIKYYKKDKFFYTDFTQEFNIYNLKIIFLFVTISFNCKCIFIWLLGITDFHFLFKKWDMFYNKQLKSGVVNGKYNLSNKSFFKYTLKSSLSWKYFVIGIPLIFENNLQDNPKSNPSRFQSTKLLLEIGYKFDESGKLLLPSYLHRNFDSKIIESLLSRGYKLDESGKILLPSGLNRNTDNNIKLLLNRGYKFDESSKILLPSGLEINTDNSIIKQINQAKLGRNILIKTSQRGAQYLSILKNNCTIYLNSQENNLRLVKNFSKIDIKNDILNCPTMKVEIENMNNNAKTESYTYGFMNMLLTQFFKLEEGYIVSPQSK